MDIFNNSSTSKKQRFLGLSGNALKIIAAVSMLCDHIGVILFPKILALRIIGRIAFPIFAFMIAEGCRYTRNKMRYFLTMFGFAAICQAVYYIYESSLEMCIFVTFSLSIIMIYALQYFKNTYFSPDSSAAKKYLAATLFLLSVAAVYVINIYLDIDYGFCGCMLPVFASLFHQPSTNPSRHPKMPDCNSVSVFMLGIGLIFLAIDSTSHTQYYSLLSLPLLLLYSGKRGKLKLKYFFYIFYPAHLVILEGICLLLG